jgi:hypothetical protein
MQIIPRVLMTPFPKTFVSLVSLTHKPQYSSVQPKI